MKRRQQRLASYRIDKCHSQAMEASCSFHVPYVLTAVVPYLIVFTAWHLGNTQRRFLSRYLRNPRQQIDTDPYICSALWRPASTCSNPALHRSSSPVELKSGRSRSSVERASRQITTYLICRRIDLRQRQQ